MGRSRAKQKTTQTHHVSWTGSVHRHRDTTEVRETEYRNGHTVAAVERTRVRSVSPGCERSSKQRFDRPLGGGPAVPHGHRLTGGLPFHDGPAMTRRPALTSAALTEFTSASGSTDSRRFDADRFSRH